MSFPCDDDDGDGDGWEDEKDQYLTFTEIFNDIPSCLPLMTREKFASSLVSFTASPS